MAGRPLEERVVVLTGASQGIGAGIAAAMHDAGARLVLAARHVKSLESGRDGLEPCLVVPCDVTLAHDRAHLIDEAVRGYGRIDVLVNNAGLARSGPAEDELAEETEPIVATNLVGPMQLSALAVRHMASGGCVVNIASLSGLRVLDRFQLASYAATKAGLIALTRELAHQWGPRGIRVNAVAPGWFPTPMTGYLEDVDQHRWIEQHTSLGRPGTLEEVAAPVVFLASDAASYVTGQVLAVDGGWV